jgi:hypothetical protein
MKEEYYSRYVKFAAYAGYIISVVEQLYQSVELAKTRNTKGIGADVVQRFVSNYEPLNINILV